MHYRLEEVQVLSTHRGVPPITSAAHTGSNKNALLKFSRTRTCVVYGAQIRNFYYTTLTRDTGRVCRSRDSLVQRQAVGSVYVIDRRVVRAFGWRRSTRELGGKPCKKFAADSG